MGKQDCKPESHPSKVVTQCDTKLGAQGGDFKEKSHEKLQIFTSHQLSLRASLVAQTVKKPSTIQETWVQFLVWEDSLEEGMATHSSILAWRIPWTEEPGGYSPWGHKESDATEQLSTEEGTGGNG